MLWTCLDISHELTLQSDWERAERIVIKVSRPLRRNKITLEGDTIGMDLTSIMPYLLIILNNI